MTSACTQPTSADSSYRIEDYNLGVAGSLQLSTGMSFTRVTYARMTDVVTIVDIAGPEGCSIGFVLGPDAKSYTLSGQATGDPPYGSLFCGVINANAAPLSGTVTVSGRTFDRTANSGQFTISAPALANLSANGVSVGGSTVQVSGSMTVGIGAAATSVASGQGGTGGQGGSTGSGGSSGSACTNSFTVASWVPFYVTAATSAGLYSNGTGRTVTVSSATATTATVSDAPGTAIIVNSTERTPGSNQYPRWQVQLLVPSNKVARNGVTGSIPVFYNGSPSGWPSAGAIGRLLWYVAYDANFGAVATDEWKTQTDYGVNKNLGTITITQNNSSGIRGTFNFTGYADGYPGSNQRSAVVQSGSFCVP